VGDDVVQCRSCLRKSGHDLRWQSVPRLDHKVVNKHGDPDERVEGLEADEGWKGEDLD
jgi:hypothetical protein